MRQTALDFHKKLLELHKRFIENERELTEKTLGRKLSPLEFLQMLTQDQDFTWLKPFSALILDIDVLTEEKEELTAADIQKIKEQIESVLLKSDPRSILQTHYQMFLKNDGEFAKLHFTLKDALR